MNKEQRIKYSRELALLDEFAKRKAKLTLTHESAILEAGGKMLASKTTDEIRVYNDNLMGLSVQHIKWELMALYEPYRIKICTFIFMEMMELNSALSMEL